MKNYNITTDQHTEIKNREFTVVKFTTNGKEYTCYSKLMQYLLSDSPVLINSETNQPESVERGEVLDIYAGTYDKGRDIFKNDIKPDASIEYLVEQYNEHYNGWKTTSEAISLFLTQSQVEKMGQAAGIRYEFEIYRQKKRNKFEPLATTLQSTEPANTQPGTKEPRKFTGKKLIDIYDPKKVHKEFRTELKCNYNTFKAWFVDSVICDKKMSWNYSGKKGEPNKAQLMRFLFVLCSGWEPAETNTAFEINVDSNNNRAKELNPDLLQRLEKCKVD